MKALNGGSKKVYFSERLKGGHKGSDTTTFNCTREPYCSVELIFE